MEIPGRITISADDDGLSINDTDGDDQLITLLICEGQSIGICRQCNHTNDSISLMIDSVAQNGWGS